MTERQFVPMLTGVFAACLLALATACGDGTVEPSAPPTPVPTTITISPASATLQSLGETAQLTAEVRDQNGQAMANAAVAWTSSDPSVAIVAASGLVTAVANGATTVTATAGSASGTAAVTVDQVVAAVPVDPATDTLLALGDTLRLSAEALDANGNAVADAEFAWSSGAPEAVTVDASGLVKAVKNGSATITATVGSASGSATVTVTQVAVSVIVTPGTAELNEPGATVQLSAQARDSNAHEVAEAGILWASDNKAVATVNGTGLVTAKGIGATTITATAGDAAGTSELKVESPPVILNTAMVYLTQAAQNRMGSVPLLAGRDAVLRVFLTGDRSSFHRPVVRATFYRRGQPIHEAVARIRDFLPTKVNEGSLRSSVNLVVPGEVLQPNTEMVVETDPDGVVPTKDGSVLRVPRLGRLRLDVRSMPTMDLTFVPVVTINHPDTSVMEWTRKITAKHPDLDLTRKTLPISDFSVRVRKPYYTNTDHRGGFEEMGKVIREIRTLHAADGANGYYYGVITQAGGGMGYIGWPVSIGLPHDGVIAHELGHNMSLLHAPPCDGADPDHPYNRGISIWGFDVEDTRLIPPTHYDIMCGGSGGWISDYHFSKMIAYRTSSGPDIADHEELVQKPLSLIISGSARPDNMILDPLLVVRAPALLPKASGGTSVVAYDRSQRALFSLRFTPHEDKFGGRAFAFAVPANPDWEVDRIVLSGPDGSFTMDRDDPRTITMLSDRETGRVRALLRNWGNASVPTPLMLEELNMRTTRAIPLSALGVVADQERRR